MEMIYIDERMIHLTLCYSIDKNNTDNCVQNHTEQFLMDNNQSDNENDTLLWLKSHCSTINFDDFVINVNPGRENFNSV